MYQVEWNVNGKKVASVQNAAELKLKPGDGDDDSEEERPKKLQRRSRETVDLGLRGSADEEPMPDEDEMPDQTDEGLEDIGPEE